MKQTIRIKESELKNLIRESVKSILTEHGRGNDWDNRKEWNNFMDPLLKQKNHRETISKNKVRCATIIKNASKILESQWFNLLKKYGCEPILSLQITDPDSGDVFNDYQSNNINEIEQYCKSFCYDTEESYAIYCYFYCDDLLDNTWKRPQIIYEILNETQCCFEITSYEKYEKVLNSVLKRYINTKRF